MGIADGFSDHEPVEQDSLRVRTDLFRHALAGSIPNSDHDLHANKPQMLEGKTRDKLRRASRNALTVKGGPYPIAEVAEMINRVDAAQGARAEKVTPT